MKLLFPAFLDCPNGICFKEQEDNEKIEILLRRHGITNLPWILTALIGYLFPVVLAKTGFFQIVKEIPSDLFLSFILFWYLLLFGFVFIHFLNWYFNIYLITNKHIIDMSFDSILSSSVTESEITDVQSARYIYKGLGGSLFHYGKVEIETASKDQTIDFDQIPYPEKVTDRIEDLEEIIKEGTSASSPNV